MRATNVLRCRLVARRRTTRAPCVSIGLRIHRLTLVEADKRPMVARFAHNLIGSLAA
jgi:hypothetical protein